LEDDLMAKRHIPMMVDPDFERLVKQIQVNIRMKNGENISLREITKRISNLPELTDIEERILSQQISVSGNFIKFDKRKK